MQPLTLHVLSDIHLYPASSGNRGRAYEKADAKSQKLLDGSAEIIEDCFDRLAADEGCRFVLISGDLTNNGEKAAHEQVILLLDKLRRSGKKVYVLTATHDYNEDGFTYGFDGDERIKVPACKREELFELYREFGPDEAIAVHRQSMSYVVQLTDGYRLFALNDDRDLAGHSGFSSECFEWITRQAQDAKENGQFIIAMTHHPLIPPSPLYALIGKNDMMGDCVNRRHELADMGIRFLLTGHTHMQDISYDFSENGNVFYDITTGSLIGYPGTYRKIVCDAQSNTVSVDTVEYAKQSSLTLSGLPLYDRMDQKLTGMIREVLDAAANDAKKFASMATAFSIKEERGRKLAILLKPTAKLLNSLTVASAAKTVRRKTGLSKGEIASLKNEKVIDFVCRLIMNLFGGDGYFVPETPPYKVTVAILDRLDKLMKLPVLKGLRSKLGADSLRELIEPLLYNGGINDHRAVLRLDAGKEDLMKDKG